jgi:hypothetical protein
LVTSASEPGRIKPDAIIEAHQARGNKARARAKVGYKIVSSEKSSARLNYDYFQSARSLHRQPRCEMRRKFTARNKDFVSGRPLEARGYRS